MEKIVFGGVGLHLSEGGAFLGPVVKQLGNDVGRFLERLPRFCVAFGQHGAAGADKTQRTRKQVELGCDGVFPQRFGLLHLLRGGVAHGV